VSRGEQAREDLAQALTAAILSHTGREQQSALERIYQQLVCPHTNWHSTPYFLVDLLCCL
jgi:hypothetical protein